MLVAGSASDARDAYLARLFDQRLQLMHALGDRQLIFGHARCGGDRHRAHVALLPKRAAAISSSAARSRLASLALVLAAVTLSEAIEHLVLAWLRW